mmetsp:Transcript_71351/g.126066  ORF Transcript_71351/g.126066 Transcript_71351/m.126066 type:complete len:200 (+) Transcript_71351:675-1274(+)
MSCIGKIAGGVDKTSASTNGASFTAAGSKDGASARNSAAGLKIGASLLRLILFSSSIAAFLRHGGLPASRISRLKSRPLSPPFSAAASLPFPFSPPASLPFPFSPPASRSCPLPNPFSPATSFPLPLSPASRHSFPLPSSFFLPASVAPSSSLSLPEALSCASFACRLFPLFPPRALLVRLGAALTAEAFTMSKMRLMR